MVEFALTLPILLLLVFGVIEFGRVFQAWVTLQNAARTAARYASTGQFNELKYPVNEDLIEDPDSVIDCVLNEDLRGSKVNLNLISGESVEIYDGREGFFATWYDGENCEPNRIDHQYMRKDIARILSIMDEARRGAAGLALGPDPLAGVTTEEQVRDFLYDRWERPVPGDGQFYDHAGADQPSFFDVMICSSRGLRFDDSNRLFRNFPTRFVTVLDPQDIDSADPVGIYDMTTARERAPVCLLNEDPQTAGGPTHNAGIPWYDPGGPGDTVSIAITFNHPLITPLGLAPYVPLEARRAAVNETFRAAEATGALQGGPAISADPNRAPIARPKAVTPGIELDGQNYVITVPVGDTDGPVYLDGTESEDPDASEGGRIVSYKWTRNLPDGEVDELLNEEGEIDNSPTPRVWTLPLGRHEIILTVTDDEGAEGNAVIVVIITEPDPTPEPTDTPEALPTFTEIPPFSCDRLSAGDVSFFNNRVYVEFTNNNQQATELTRAEFHWRPINGYPNMHVSGMVLDGLLHWRGQDFSSPTDTNADPSDPPNLFQDSDKRVAGLSDATWEAVFANGPSPLQDPFRNIFHMTQHDLSGTTFTFLNPEGGFCVIPLILPTPTPEPTFDPNQPSPTPTWTPDCAGTDVRINYVSFHTFGVVRLTVTNLRSVASEFTDFNINWVARNNQRLEWVAVGGESATDRINGLVVWQADPGQDTSPPTVAGTTSATQSLGREGNWLTNYSFPPDSTTNLWIKFGVTNTTPDDAFGMRPSDLNGSWFQIGCPQPGGGDGGSGDTPGGRVHIFEEPSPFPSNTPSITPTPSNTYTPSATFTPSNTPLPPTITDTPEPRDTDEPPETEEPDPPGGPGGGDGSGDTD